MIKRFLKSKWLLIGLGVVVALGLIIPSVYSSGPQFNYMPDDLEMLVARNYSEDGKWNDPINADSEDVVSFQFYYHNGVENTVAKNTRVRADLPKTASKKLVVDGYLWADNADIVADTATINTDSPQMLKYIPGSTKWFPDRSQTGQSISDGIVSDNGVSIGNIKGCWPFAGFVTFRAKLVDLPEAELIKSKSAFNITRGVDAQSVVAKPGDRVRYSLKVENTGNASDSIVISDDISKVLRYASMVDLGGGSLTGSTISWPKTTVKPGKSVSKQFVVEVKDSIPANKLVYLVNFFGNRVEVPAKKEVTINPGLNLSKKVRNITRGEKNFVNKNQANPGDTLEYLITARNPGDVRLTNHLILDALPAKASFIEGSVKYGYNNAPIDKKGNNSLVTGGGDSFGEFFTGSRLNITFRAKVDSDLGPGNYKLINRASNEARFETEIDSGRLTGSARATTVINVQAQPDFSIDKKVKNLTHPTNYSDQITAKAGDRVAYKITLKNTSDVEINHLELIDILPANSSLVRGSVRIILDSHSNKFYNNIVSQYVGLPQLAPGKQIVVTLKADTDEHLVGGSKLINTAKARYNVVKKDSATVIIQAPKVKAVKIKGPMPKSGFSWNWLYGILGPIGAYYGAYQSGAF